MSSLSSALLPAPELEELVATQSGGVGGGNNKS